MRTIHHTCKIIRKHEDVIAAAQARYKMNVGLVVITDQRILFCNARFLRDVNIAEFNLSAVSSVSYRLGFLNGEVCFRIAKDDVNIKNLSRKTTKAVANSVHLAKAKTARKSASHAQPDQSELDRIEQLYDLYQRGALTDDEFDRFKFELIEASGFQSDVLA